MDSLLKLNLLSQQMPLEPDSAPAPNAAAPCGHAPDRDLKKLGVLADRAAPFILLNGRRANPQLALGL